MPDAEDFSEENQLGFSIERANEHVKNISKKPHSIGTKAHSEVRNYIVQELQKLGLQVQTQKGYSLNPEGVFTVPENIIAKIPGSDPSPKNDLMVMTHYDSAVHSSYGASDAASGVATILESLRVFLKEKVPHKNNIIICFTDAEEIGLNGAELFVKEHPWANNIGLVLNFEARGSGGPSNTILETNAGNQKLIKAFAKAHPEYPVATSLMYSVYKKLPNDTDATVLREKKNVPSFFFAFIDDHYDYHTANDTFKNLDQNSEEVQIRTNLQETAFFLPQLTTDNEGNVSFSFTTPEALTKWKLQLLAHTKTLNTGTSTLETVTQKELMVLPNPPRFLRQRDTLVLSTKIASLAEEQLSGSVELQLINPLDNATVNNQLGLYN